MITAVERKIVPYVLEEDRNNTADDQTLFWIMPKRSHEANQTLSRYGGTSKDGRQGYRDFSVTKLDDADIKEFCSLVEKVEKFILAPDSNYFGQFKGGVIVDTTDKMILTEIARSMSSAHLTEIFDAAGDSHKLEQGHWVGDKQTNLQEKLEIK